MFLAVALGAFGAHALRQRLTPELLSVFEVGVRYHVYHALALFAVAWVSRALGKPRSGVGLGVRPGHSPFLGKPLSSGAHRNEVARRDHSARGGRVPRRLGASLSGVIALTRSRQARSLRELRPTRIFQRNELGRGGSRLRSAQVARVFEGARVLYFCRYASSTASFNRSLRVRTARTGDLSTPDEDGAPRLLEKRAVPASRLDAPGTDEHPSLDDHRPDSDEAVISVPARMRSIFSSRIAATILGLNCIEDRIGPGEGAIS